MGTRVRPVPLLVLFALILTATMPDSVSAEGERYDRIVLPEPAPQQDEAMLSRLEAEVIVSAFTRVNKSLDRSTAAKYASHVLEAAGEFGVDPFMVASIIIRESTVRQNAHSRCAYGLMQVNWKAHRKGLTKAFQAINSIEDLLQPRNNVLAGTYIFSWYLKSCGGDMDKALYRYLGRTGRKYVSRVMSGFQDMKKELEKYRKKYGSKPTGSAVSMAFAVE